MSTTTTSGSDNMNIAHYYRQCHQSKSTTPPTTKWASHKLKTSQKHKMPLNISKLSTTTTSDSENMSTAHYYIHGHWTFQQCQLTQREQLLTSELPNTTYNATKHLTLSTTTTRDSDNMNNAHYYKHCHWTIQQCQLQQKEHLIISKLPITANNATKHFKTVHYKSQWLW